MIKLRATFLSRLATRAAPVYGHNFKELTEPLRYYSLILGQVVEVPTGFPTDLASFRLGSLALTDEQVDPAAAVHDYGYATGTRWRIVWDLVFYEAQRAAGVGKWAAVRRTAAVMLAGWKPWRDHRKGRTAATRWLKFHHHTTS